GLLAAPVLQCLGDKFRPVVNANLFGSTPPLGELVEFANHPLTGQARIDSDRQDLPIEIVDDVECPEWLSLKKAVVNEVHGPGQIRVQRLYQRLLYSQRKPFLILTPKIKSHLGIDSVNTFVVILEIHRPEPMIHHPKAPSAMQVCHLSQLRPDRLIIFRLWFIANY